MAEPEVAGPSEHEAATIAAANVTVRHAVTASKLGGVTAEVVVLNDAAAIADLASNASKVVATSGTV